MGLFNAILGNASKADNDEIAEKLSPILVEGETIECAFKLIRDYFVFTNKRLVMVDIQGITGKKKQFHSVPYKSITQFSIETTGSFDLDAEMKIWVSSQATPIEKQFKKSGYVLELQKALAKAVLS